MNASVSHHDSTLDPSNQVAVNVLGTLGAVFWSIQLIPQIYLNYRRKSTTGLQPSMMFLWALAGLPLGMHNILSNLNVALQVQPQILTLLSLITWTQVMLYGHRWSFWKCSVVLSILSILFAGVEISVVFGFKYGSPNPVPSGFLTFLAVLSALGLALGVLRHYYDIYTHDSVRGISWIFVGLDAMGDLTSLLSVVIQSRPDIKSAAIYGVELVLWIGIMLAGLWFKFRSIYSKRSSTEIEAVDSVISSPDVRRDSTDRREATTYMDQTAPPDQGGEQYSTSVFRTSATSLVDLRSIGRKKQSKNRGGSDHLRLRRVETVS